MVSFFYVGIGGFFGANARYFLSGFITNRFIALTGMSFPLGTLVVNVLGSFLLAFFLGWFNIRLDISPQMRLLVGTGFFGAFTTFSTFATEAVALATDQSFGLAIIYFILTNVICIVGVLLGLLLAHRLFAMT